jgi:hypothetical protein
MRLALFVVLPACVESATVAPPDATESWATYTIAAGAHDARLSNRGLKNPIDGVVGVVGRDYELALNTTAMYVLATPTQPEDQHDWNKLPGLSDCNTIDLSVDGAMFGWRWRIDPPALEIIAYANNASKHLWLDAPMVTLDADDLASDTPLRYHVARRLTEYAFEIRGSVRGRAIDVTASLPRGCLDTELDPLAWASGLYFGGTSTAPHEITARIDETPYVE